MDLRKLLREKGYDVQTKNRGIGWQCTLEWHNRIQTFTGPTEAESIKLAATFVAQLEESFQIQQARLRCESCGDG